MSTVLFGTLLRKRGRALVRALAYFEEILGSRIADINHILYLQARATK
jgi:hypothetical protein